MQVNHWFYGGVNAPDDLNETDLAQLDDDLSRRAGAEMKLRAQFEGVDRLAMDMIEPSRKPRPVPVMAAAAMSAPQLANIQDRRQQEYQFGEQLQARKDEQAQGFKQQTQLEQMRSAQRQRVAQASAASKLEVERFKESQPQSL